MNKIDHIYTTISNGQVHIAADTKYIGSVDSYNNSFTQFFSWLSDSSIQVNFDGKLRTINKQSYTNLIQSLNQGQKNQDISQSTMFRPIAEAAAFPPRNLKMRDVITDSDRKELFKKLANAISDGNTNKAILLIGKGADLDANYYDRDQISPSFSKDTFNLDPHSRYKFTVFKAPPILQAAKKGNKTVCEALKKAGADLSIKGQEYSFKREIINIERGFEPILEVKKISVPCQTNAEGIESKNPKQATVVEVTLQERIFINTKDSRSNYKTYRLDPANLDIQEL